MLYMCVYIYMYIYIYIYVVCARDRHFRPARGARAATQVSGLLPYLDRRIRLSLKIGTAQTHPAPATPCFIDLSWTYQMQRLP